MIIEKEEIYMSNNSSKSGAFGILGVIACIAAFFAAKSIFPQLAKILLIAMGIIVFLIIVLVVLVIYFSTHKSDSKNSSSNASRDRILSDARKKFTDIKLMNIKVKNTDIKNKNNEVCAVIEKIFKTLKEQPENIPNVNQFLNYYIPTLSTIITKYRRVEESGVPAEELTKNTLVCLEDIKLAMDKQYANLFEDDMIDLSVEMEALTATCKRDGLLDDEDFTLTL